MWNEGFDMKITSAIVFTLLFMFWMVFRIVAEVSFDRNCEGYLKRAADANTVALAIENLEVSVDYAERSGLTSGYTSIVYATPDEDMGFWYQNLKASLEELRAVEPETPQLERTNILMKLRETLLDEGKGVSVTVPSGITVYPNNGLVALWGCLSFLFACGFWIPVLVELDRGY